ncbi:hypothetical protein [Mucilaginibacter sp. dw_454]|uniref:hypothetical protein n=1 Tax=Mucilaginibacter sp. dw_454 TaxID=2720079 RepID=UPI001BD285E0|nr:hypothetical protein [Mucilaginibacter sp. dw_454]
MKIRNYIFAGLGLVTFFVAVFVYSCKRDGMSTPAVKKDYAYYQANLSSNPDIVAVFNSHQAFINTFSVASKKRIVSMMRYGTVPDSLKKPRLSIEQLQKIDFGIKTMGDLERSWALRGFAKDTLRMAGNLAAGNASLVNFVKSDKEFWALPQEQRTSLLKDAFLTLLKNSRSKKGFSLFKKVQEPDSFGCYDTYNTTFNRAQEDDETANADCISLAGSLELACMMGGPEPATLICLAGVAAAEEYCQNSATNAYNTTLDRAEDDWSSCVRSHTSAYSKTTTL